MPENKRGSNAAKPGTGQQGWQAKVNDIPADTDLGGYTVAQLGPFAQVVADARRDLSRGGLENEDFREYFNQISEIRREVRKVEGVPRHAYLEAGAAIKDVFSTYLADKHLGSDYTENQQKVIFEKAWEDGHAEGLRQIEGEYMELVEFVDKFNA